jgi:hypothetical protein
MKATEHAIERVAAVVIGFVMMVVGLGLGVTMIIAGWPRHWPDRRGGLRRRIVRSRRPAGVKRSAYTRIAVLETCVPSIGATDEQFGVDEMVKELNARPIIEGPQALRLLAGQPKARHFDIFSPQSAQRLLTRRVGFPT